MDATDWDARYGGNELVWGLEPNRFVAAELADLPAGRALDLACGEGRNAIWLASLGWHVTGLDFSAAAIDRARCLAADAGVAERAEFLVANVLETADAEAPPAGSFDAVVVAYLQLTAPARRAALRRAAGWLAPGGTLLVVAHDVANLTDGIGGPRDASVLYTPDSAAADLADLPELTIEKAERALRPVATPDGQVDAIDTLLRAHRAA
ncbi:class I SAM-dependent methyltransferase [Frankia sp. CNm7]|uniref:Class I SAM-dependent methyltransferase n=1 Tax=Frankia nepalensis TaxID=1836974 RepID=A0A937RGN6_9ACTN|nr:class I SAM-dependent methyltransferase [Frankia nepalensis]MBL7495315.1 class I SAM-dependent methyltransferase [Frankia nepalensis]MBL7509694.1 class I SAM-dependent methyltransferase [Frankia nepalensis]MBL7517629.1 class I SAM-dependent methyltransferase [Frankia nepalensis]MBL7631848.1 class I SAM-dependent methyltransferase [Frankia nepalensis]